MVDYETRKNVGEDIEQKALIIPSSHDGLLEKLSEELILIQDQNGINYIVIQNSSNPQVLRIGSDMCNAFIFHEAKRYKIKLGQRKLNEVNEILTQEAKFSNNKRDVYVRNAPIDGGVEIDLGDDKHRRVRISAGKYEIIEEGSTNLFSRPEPSLPMALPKQRNDSEHTEQNDEVNTRPAYNFLKRYLNLQPQHQFLLTAWIAYTLALPKIPTSNFVILILGGEQGTGKSSLCKNILSKLIDPSLIGVQTMPKNEKDLAIATQNSHVLFYDNQRNINPKTSDLLCSAATGANLASRALYTDDGQNVLSLHSAIVINGIHTLVDQPDLAERCLPLQMLPIDENKRKSETELVKEFNADLPYIMHDLFTLIAEVFIHLEDVKVVSPERMFDFSRWLAAMEKVYETPEGVYQQLYSDTLREGELETLMSDALATAVIDFAEEMKKKGDHEWSGTPTECLNELQDFTDYRTSHSKEWPSSVISMSKRLQSLKEGLRKQGISVEISRGKERKITIFFSDQY